MERNQETKLQNGLGISPPRMVLLTVSVETNTDFYGLKCKTSVTFRKETCLKVSACNAGAAGRHGFDPWVGKIPLKKAWQPAPVFSPGEFHGQRSLAGYSPWLCKELDMTEVT